MEVVLAGTEGAETPKHAVDLTEDDPRMRRTGGGEKVVCTPEKFNEGVQVS